MTLDSIGYDLRDSTLQALALASKNASVLKTGTPYTKEKIANEINRLLDIYHDNGYLRLTREDIYAEVDTLVSGLLDPGLDPFEQAQLLEEMQKRREHPRIDVRFRQRGTENPDHVRQFHFGNVNIYPDQQLIADTTLPALDTIRRGRIHIYQHTNAFKPGFLVRNNQIRPGALYKEQNVNLTSNAFSQMTAWKQVGIELVPHDSTGIVDANIRMYMARKYSLGWDFEVSWNQSDLNGAGIVTVGIAPSYLFGLGISGNVQNRNMARQSISSNTSLRFGVELGNGSYLFQTFLANLSQTYTIPKFVTPFAIKAERTLPRARTFLTGALGYTDRRSYYATRTANASIAYDWLNKKNRNWTYSPLNVEYLKLTETPWLTGLFDSIPNLRNIFSDGLIISQNLVMQTSWKRSNKLLSVRARLDESGALFGLVKNIDINWQLYRFIKPTIDLRYLATQRKSAWAFRFFAGYGYPYGNQKDSLGNTTREQTLPFFKSFYAGGPNSMRGWQIRQLGPGSSTYFSNNADRKSIDRFADIQLEANVEYRFDVATVFGFKVKSALFADVGNVWYRNNMGNPDLDDAVFRLNKLYRDIAVDAGTSLRFDFNYFLIRFDWAYKVKNPQYATINKGWFYDAGLFKGETNLLKGQFQLGINYPF
ncbi:MAG: BamA/TamA family outer membrane protein [Flavihumibacter sp.]